MSKLSKLLLILLILTTILPGGCKQDRSTTSEQQNVDKTFIYQPTGKPVYAPTELLYFMENPLDIAEVTVGGDYGTSYVQISGLKDKEIESAINNRIKDLFDQLILYATGEKLPPYRGIKSVIDENAVIEHNHISFYPSFNSHNILSITAQMGYHNTTDYLYVSITETLNFDLTTGKTFFIEDVFTNDAAGLVLVNDALISEARKLYLASEIDFYYQQLTPVAPFKGINSKQKFYLSYDALHVVIDYLNPEFETNFTAVTISIPFYAFDNQLAITERFFPVDNKLYVKDINNIIFYQIYPSGYYDYVIYNKGGIEWSLYTLATDFLPQVFDQIIDEHLHKHLDKLISSSESEEANIVHGSIHIHANKTGPFVNISINSYTEGEHSYSWRDNYYTHYLNGHPVELKDLFINDFDYEELIALKLKEAAAHSRIPEPTENEFSLETLEFNIYNTGISFISINYNKEDEQTQPLYFDLSFAEIGLKNLSILSEE